MSLLYGILGTLDKNDNLLECRTIRMELSGASSITVEQRPFNLRCWSQEQTSESNIRTNLRDLQAPVTQMINRSVGNDSLELSMIPKKNV